MFPDDEEDEGNDDANRPDDTNIPVIDGIEGSVAAIDECERECKSDASSDATSSDFPPTESKQFEVAEAASCAAANSHDDERRDSNHGAFPLGRKSPHATQHCNTWSQSACAILTIDTKRAKDRRTLPDYNFLTVQMSAKRGLHQFGQKGADILMKELQQLIDWQVKRPCDANILS